MLMIMQGVRRLSRWKSKIWREKRGIPDLDPAVDGVPIGACQPKGKPMKNGMSTILLSCLFAVPAHADCGVDPAAVDARIGQLTKSYPLVLSDIACDAPTLWSHQALCDSANAPQDGLWQMARLADLAWVYAVENATGQASDPANPPRDKGFLAARDACTTEECLCALLIEHTNASLGGTSPYPQ
jgi:hypothetical protein